MLPSIVVHRVRYKLLRPDGENGNLGFLLRSEGGELFGVYAATRKLLSRPRRSS